MHLDHGSALQCTWILGVHFSVLGSWECTSVPLDHGSALEGTWIMGVHYSALALWECT